MRVEFRLPFPRPELKLSLSSSSPATKTSNLYTDTLPVSYPVDPCRSPASSLPESLGRFLNFLNFHGRVAMAEIEHAPVCLCCSKQAHARANTPLTSQAPARLHSAARSWSPSTISPRRAPVSVSFVRNTSEVQIQIGRAHV